MSVSSVQILPKSPYFIQGATWAVENILSFPVDTDLTNSAFLYMNVLQLIFRIVINLEKLFVKKTTRSARSFESDQYQLFHQVEKSLAQMGVNGKGCLLRTICEMQKRPIDHYSIMGEIVTVLMTPRRGANDFLREYLEAEEVGMSNRSCRAEYPQCPISLFNLLSTYSTPDDKPVDHGQHSSSGKEKRPSPPIRTQPISKDPSLDAHHYQKQIQDLDPHLPKNNLD